MKIYKKKGNTYNLAYSNEGEKIVLSMNGVAAEQTWYDSIKKIWFAPFETKEGNFWVVLSGQRLYLINGGDSMTEEDFRRNYLADVYSAMVAKLYSMLLIWIPAIAYWYVDFVYGEGTIGLFAPLVAAIGHFWFTLMRTYICIPVKKRKILFHLSLLPTVVLIIGILMTLGGLKTI